MLRFILLQILLVVPVVAFARCLPQRNCSEYKYLHNRISPDNHRFTTFIYILRLLKERHAQVLVETGTARYGNKNCSGDGCSTLIFADWIGVNGGQFYSVDISELALHDAAESLGAANEFVHLVQSDSIEFLKKFNQPIDFLYLDSFDFDLDNPAPSQQHHLKEIIAAYPWLTEQTIVMIDDCNLPHGGKGKLVIEYLLNRNWKIVAQDYQTILVKE